MKSYRIEVVIFSTLGALQGRRLSHMRFCHRSLSNRMIAYEGILHEVVADQTVDLEVSPL